LWRPPLAEAEPACLPRLTKRAQLSLLLFWCEAANLVAGLVIVVLATAGGAVAPAWWVIVLGVIVMGQGATIGTLRRWLWSLR
jgi:hypothetical protein